MKKIYSRPKSLKKVPFHYCPGCGHSIIHRLIAEVIDELKLHDNIVGIPPPGCSVFAHHYFDIDMAESAHGREAAVATGMKRPNSRRFEATRSEAPKDARAGRSLPSHRSRLSSKRSTGAFSEGTS